MTERDHHPNLPPGLEFGVMRPEERATLGRWAVDEGWNPGLGDLSVVASIDPACFIALRSAEGLVAGGTIFRPASRLGFMGLFIVHPDQRGAGLGRSLWCWRRDLLLARLDRPATIGMDGVYDLVPFYGEGGFVLDRCDLRFEGGATGVADVGVRDLVSADLPDVVRLDEAAFGASRRRFLGAWMWAPGVRSVGLRMAHGLVGFAVRRPAVVGYKLGPVVADSPSSAARLVGHLLADIQGEQVQLDVPESNVNGVALARSLGLSESFGCARMYLGPAPDVDVAALYGVASFEFG